MLLDLQNEFSAAQAVTATAISTNVVDTIPMTGNPNTTQNLGGVGAAYLVLTVDTTFTAAGAATLSAALVSDSTANLATSPTTHITAMNAVAVASLVAGLQLVIQLPPGDYERYVGIQYTVATGPMTAGAISAIISRDHQRWKAYATLSAAN